MTDKSEGPTNPYGHEDCDDISGCGDKCKISAWDNGYAAGFKAGLERAARIIVENEERRTTSTHKAYLGPRDTGNIGGMGFAETIREEIKKI